MKFDWEKNKSLPNVSLQELFDLGRPMGTGSCSVKIKGTPSFPGKNRQRNLRKKSKQSRKINRGLR